MKLSTRSRYGVKAMFDLAQHAGEGPISLKSIAERQGISEHYLEQLISGLRKAGLVTSIRGAQGGYVLGREADQIRVGDVIRVLEGSIAPVDCVSEEDPECCQKAKYCVTRTIWEKVRDSIADVVDSITLANMVQDAKGKESERNFDIFYN
ncbi:RrF2 family transcriptional regulator [Desulfitobacterium metallireducens]|uniref:AsnC family transcriptional regulator n=1 Tax=Desulfitobacterium metallireducens DSM 15288 TaxID=871968 RepID=W0E9K8_9FIRM|nr:Rrf2 family transcriptional regulator [Desulfitobacterium metallireducens]AHF07452.1 AsnC family transcriptional regulator [Desulfitobacterium metallireducens DSM 15288]